MTFTEFQGKKNVAEIIGAKLLGPLINIDIVACRNVQNG
jgi:hypothetical protein